MNRIKITNYKYLDKYIIGLLILATSFLEIGILLFSIIHKISYNIYFIPIVMLLILFALILLSKNIIYQFRVLYTYFIFSLIISHILSLLVLWNYVTAINNIISQVTYVFVGLFYGTFLWDFFMNIPLIHIYKNGFTNILSQEASKDNNHNKIYAKELLPAISTKMTSVLGYVMTYLALPIVFLGRAGAYYFGVLVADMSRDFNVNGYSITIIFFPVSLRFILQISFIVIALFKLKYPTQEEIEAYKSKGKV